MIVYKINIYIYIVNKCYVNLNKTNLVKMKRCENKEDNIRSCCPILEEQCYNLATSPSLRYRRLIAHQVKMSLFSSDIWHQWEVDYSSLYHLAVLEGKSKGSTTISCLEKNEHQLILVSIRTAHARTVIINRCIIHIMKYKYVYIE